jgi:GDP-L-fucose synthase
MSDLKYRKIMVTGSSAVLGTGIRAISNAYSKSEFYFLNSKDCNLTNSRDTLSIVKKLNPDAIVHLAAVSGGIGLSIQHHASMLRDICLMTFSVLEAAKECAVGKVVMTLTTGMYPPDAPLPLTEDSIHEGYPHGSNYGSSFGKRIIDPAIRAYRDEYGLDVIGLIPNGIFGEGDNFNDDHASMLPALIRRFLENKNGSGPIVIWGDGTPLREYTYAQDLARAYFWALQNYSDRRCLNVGTVEEHSVKEIAFMIAGIMGINKNRITFDTTKPSGVFRKNTDNSNFVKLSGFTYTPLRDALEKTIKWFCETYEKNPDQIRISGKSKQYGRTRNEI